MCQAIIEDFENPSFRATRQRITVPGRKTCSRKGVEQVGPLNLCKTHARLAHDGFVALDGEVVGQNDIREYRQKMARKPGMFSAPHNWTKSL